MTHDGGWKEAQQLLVGNDAVYTESLSSTETNDPVLELVRVKSIRGGSNVDVWDIAVDKHSTFLANGVVVHNCDEMKLDIWKASLGQNISSFLPYQLRPSCPAPIITLMETMTEILKQAKEKGWKRYEWCYRETMEPHGWLMASEIERKKNEVTQAMWDTEFDLQEPSFEGRAIITENVEAMFLESLGTYDGAANEYLEFEAPIEGGAYVHGVDWARKQDWTVIVTLRIDVEPYMVVAFERTGRLQWPIMTEKLDNRMDRYGGTTCHDATGIGDVVASMIKHDVVPFLMVGKARTELLNNYVVAVEHDEILCPRIEFMYGEHKYATNDDLYGAGHLPDTVSAMAVAYKQAKSVDNSPITVDDLVKAMDSQVQALQIGG